MRRVSSPGLWRSGGVGLLWLAFSGAHSDGAYRAQIRLEPGQWEIREFETSRIKPRLLCVRDPAVLIQLEHAQTTCAQTVVTNTAQTLVVHYVCRVGGYGQTAVRMETPRLARIDTQGIVARSPFAYRAEARRVGACVRQETARR